MCVQFSNMSCVEVQRVCYSLMYVPLLWASNFVSCYAKQRSVRTYLLVGDISISFVLEVGCVRVA